MEKYLIASGDSWTDPNFISDIHPEMKFDFPKWPELLAKKLNMKVINLGRSGQGNEYIHARIVDRIASLYPEQIGMVIAAWSKSERRDWSEIAANGVNWCANQTWTASRYDTKGDIPYFIARSYRYYYSLQQICKSLDIPYRQVQMISLFEHFCREIQIEDGHPMMHLRRNKEQNILRSIQDSPYFSRIDDRYFMGWPGTEKLGGYAVQDITNPRREVHKMVSHRDHHPNELGHKLIADFIYENL